VEPAVAALGAELHRTVVPAVQIEQRGTGHAVGCGLDPLPADLTGPVLVTYGDVPLLEPATLTALLDEHARSGAAVTLLTTQLGIVGVLAATFMPGDVSQSDTALVGMSAVYAFALTGLVQHTLAIADKGREDTNLSPTLVAPLLGMAVGGLLAIPLELSTERIFKLTALPIGVGAMMLVGGTALADGVAVPLSALGGVVATFVITALATAEPPPGAPPTLYSRERQSDGIKALPMPVLMRAGRDGNSLAAGPGMLLRF